MTESYRSRFTPSAGTYLLSHSVGRPPVTTVDVWTEHFLSPWQDRGEQVWPCWLQAIAGFRSALSRLLNSPADNFCPQTNLSSALTKILQSLPTREGRDTILYCEEDFPSIAFVLQQAQRYGYKLRSIGATLDTNRLTNWVDSFDAATAIVLVTHVQSNTGRQVPVTEITREARSRDILSIVDIAQSAGCIPIDLETWSADLVIGSAVKWLCGGPGAGYLWVHPRLTASCEPLDVGWFSHEDPFEFDVHSFRYAKNADRFWGGTPSVQPFVLAANSINTLCEIGIDTVRAHNIALTELLIAHLPPGSLVAPRTADQRGGTLVVSFDAPVQTDFAARLTAAGVLYDIRASGIRLSPHIYNDSSDMETVIACLPA